MRSVSLIVLAMVCTAWAWGKPSSQASMQQAIERAISLGKAGQIDLGLAQLEPYLDRPTARTAKACYVAGFLFKERYKTHSSEPAAAADREAAVRWLGTALELQAQGPTTAPWTTSARQAMNYLGGTLFDDAVKAVRTFEPGQEADVFALLDAHVEVARALDPTVDATAERTEFHKNLARAYRQWFEATEEEAHFEGIVAQYQAALALSPGDITATYNLAVNIYNRGVAQINAMDENTSLAEIFLIQDASTALFQRALPWFEKADALQPNRPETLRGLMIVHHALFHAAEEEAYRVQLEEALKR